MSIFLFVAGIGAGLVGYLVGLASLISYPALIFAGYPPVTANVSNTVGVVGIGIGSAFKARRALIEPGDFGIVPQAIVIALGGLTGGVLLLTAGESIFKIVVPWLILLGSIMIVVSPRLRKLRGGKIAPAWVYYPFAFLVAVYGGYFGAGAGVLFVTLMLLTTTLSVHRAVLFKTVLLAAANGAASIFFIAQGEVDWGAAILIGAGAFIGGYLGPLVQRFFSEVVLRWVVACGGVILTIWLLTQ